MNSSIKKQRFASYNVICMPYIYVYINETNIFKFWHNVSKTFSTCLIDN